MTDYELMGAALEEAARAAALGEVPVGAVVARNGEIIAAAHNTRETEKNALHHAELLAIDAACKKLGGWRLWQCELFVTQQPALVSAAPYTTRLTRLLRMAPLHKMCIRDRASNYASLFTYLMSGLVVFSIGIPCALSLIHI